MSNFIAEITGAMSFYRPQEFFRHREQFMNLLNNREFEKYLTPKNKQEQNDRFISIQNTALRLDAITSAVSKQEASGTLSALHTEANRLRIEGTLEEKLAHADLVYKTYMELAALEKGPTFTSPDEKATLTGPGKRGERKPIPVHDHVKLRAVQGEIFDTLFGPIIEDQIRSIANLSYDDIPNNARKAWKALRESKPWEWISQWGTPSKKSGWENAAFNASSAEHRLNWQVARQQEQAQMTAEIDLGADGVITGTHEFITNFRKENEGKMPSALQIRIFTEDAYKTFATRIQSRYGSYVERKTLGEESGGVQKDYLFQIPQSVIQSHLRKALSKISDRYVGILDLNEVSVPVGGFQEMLDNGNPYLLMSLSGAGSNKLSGMFGEAERVARSKLDETLGVLARQLKAAKDNGTQIGDDAIKQISQAEALLSGRKPGEPRSRFVVELESAVKVTQDVHKMGTNLRDAMIQNRHPEPKDMLPVIAQLSKMESVLGNMLSGDFDEDGTEITLPALVPFIRQGKDSSVPSIVQTVYDQIVESKELLSDMNSWRMGGAHVLDGKAKLERYTKWWGLNNPIDPKDRSMLTELENSNWPSKTTSPYTYTHLLATNAPIAINFVKSNPHIANILSNVFNQYINPKTAFDNPQLVLNLAKTAFQIRNAALIGGFEEETDNLKEYHFAYGLASINLESNRNFEAAQLIANYAQNEGQSLPDAMSLGSVLAKSVELDKDVHADVSKLVMKNYKSAGHIETVTISNEVRDSINFVLKHRLWGTVKSQLSGTDADEDRYDKIVQSTAAMVMSRTQVDMLSTSQPEWKIDSRGFWAGVGTRGRVSEASLTRQLVGQEGMTQSPLWWKVQQASRGDPQFVAKASMELSFAAVAFSKIDYWKQQFRSDPSLAKKHGMGPIEFALQPVGYQDVQTAFPEDMTGSRKWFLRHTDDLVAEERKRMGRTDAALSDTLDYSYGGPNSIWGDVRDQDQLSSITEYNPRAVQRTKRILLSDNGRGGTNIQFYPVKAGGGFDGAATRKVSTGGDKTITVPRMIALITHPYTQGKLRELVVNTKGVTQEALDMRITRLYPTQYHFEVAPIPQDFTPYEMYKRNEPGLGQIPLSSLEQFSMVAYEGLENRTNSISLRTNPFGAARATFQGLVTSTEQLRKLYDPKVDEMLPPFSDKTPKDYSDTTWGERITHRLDPLDRAKFSSVPRMPEEQKAQLRTWSKNYAASMKKFGAVFDAEGRAAEAEKSKVARANEQARHMQEISAHGKNFSKQTDKLPSWYLKFDPKIKALFMPKDSTTAR